MSNFKESVDQNHLKTLRPMFKQMQATPTMYQAFNEAFKIIHIIKFLCYVPKCKLQEQNYITSNVMKHKIGIKSTKNKTEQRYNIFFTIFQL